MPDWISWILHVDDELAAFAYVEARGLLEADPRRSGRAEPSALEGGGDPGALPQGELDLERGAQLRHRRSVGRSTLERKARVSTTWKPRHRTYARK